MAINTVESLREEDILGDLKQDDWICDDISNWL